MPHPKGGYKLKNGQRVPGVTTIIGRFKDSSALLWWAFAQGKSAERGEISNLYEKRDIAGEAGTLAHLMVENYIKGIDKTDTDGYAKEVIKKATQGFNNFRTWFRNQKMEIIQQEIILVSEGYRYGGCPDAFAKNTSEKLCLLDWKTGDHVYTDHIIQLAAYCHLWLENYPDQPLTGGFHLCRFSKEHADFSHHYWSELNDAWELFKLYRKAYDLDKKLKKRIG
jgi:hypothetical protein